MGRQLVVLAIGIVVIASVTVRVQRRARQRGRLGMGSQLLVGFVCGLVGALVAVVPHGDTIPDRLEAPVGAGVGAVVLVFAARTVRPRRTAPAGGQPPVVEPDAGVEPEPEAGAQPSGV